MLCTMPRSEQRENLKAQRITFNKIGNDERTYFQITNTENTWEDINSISQDAVQNVHSNSLCIR